MPRRTFPCHALALLGGSNHRHAVPSRINASPCPAVATRGEALPYHRLAVPLLSKHILASPLPVIAAQWHAFPLLFWPRLFNAAACLVYAFPRRFFAPLSLAPPWLCAFRLILCPAVPAFALPPRCWSVHSSALTLLRSSSLSLCCSCQIRAIPSRFLAILFTAFALLFFAWLFNAFAVLSTSLHIRRLSVHSVALAHLCAARYALSLLGIAEP